MKRLIRSVRHRINAGTALQETDQAAATLTPSHGDPPYPAAVSSPSSVRHDAPFRYTPLTSALSFRILHLRQAPGDSDMEHDERPLRGSLVEASLEAPPEYFALSYTWGDPAPCEAVELDGRRLGITANCASALRCMMRGATQMYIWVDSICINQAETPEALQERSGQVAMMDQIYRNAVQVNVHLGAGDAASDVACEALKSLSQYCLGAVTPGPEQEAFRRKYENLADDILAITPDFPGGKLYGVFRLPWFRRTWVVQEVVLGRVVVLYCGKHLMPLKTVTIGADFKRLPYTKYGSNVLSTHWQTYLNYHEGIQEFVRRKERGESLCNLDFTLSTVLLGPALSLDATRPEDKIYGLYGVCKRLGFELPAPDYSKPLAVVYTEATRAILSYEAGLDILSGVCESSGWECGIPSWVPNFSGCIRRWSPSNPPHLIVYDSSRKNPKISGHTHCQYDFMLQGQALGVRGRRLDVLCAAGQPWKLDVSKTRLGDSAEQTAEDILSLLDCIGSWFDVVQGDRPQGRLAVQLLAQVLIQNSSQPLSAERLEAFARYLSPLVSCSRSGGDPHHMALADPQESPLDYYLVGPYVISKGVYNVVESLLANNSWKTVFRTVAGYLGVGTHSVQDGDIIAVFYGFPMAAVLRPWDDWFRYVGPAYVDGIMNGEFWDASSAEDDETFVLV
ncbi:hypothetical protein DL769_000654 [Monosporascus sp. CRB-8-3]|nr:hypothetical protein DL769_000654 [Monosporascus sp. CRB-8-3]